jgi:hypothetical protein
VVWGGLAIAIAASLLAALWVGGLLGSGFDRPPGVSRADEKLPAGTEWTATEATATREIGPHRAVLARRARLRVLGGTARSPELELRQGKVGFTVAPLRGGGFTVRTQQVRVTVLGTLFAVEVDPRCTRVEVTRGLVRVQSHRGGLRRELRGGEALAVCDAQSKANQLDADAQIVLRAITMLRKGENLEQAEKLLASYLERRPDGTHAEEALFFQVLIKERLGQHDESMKLARTFIDRFPSTSRAKTMRSWLEKKTHGSNPRPRDIQKTGEP